MLCCRSVQVELTCGRWGKRANHPGVIVIVTSATTVNFLSVRLLQVTVTVNLD